MVEIKATAIHIACGPADVDELVDIEMFNREIDGRSPASS
jgi:hypothetical protein